MTGTCFPSSPRCALRSSANKFTRPSGIFRAPPYSHNTSEASTYGSSLPTQKSLVNLGTPHEYLFPTTPFIHVLAGSAIVCSQALRSFPNPCPQGRDRQEKEANHSRLVGGSFNEQRELTSEACLNGCKASRCPHPLATPSKFIYKALSGLSQVYCLDGLNTTSPSPWLCPWGSFWGMEMQMEGKFPDNGRGRGEPPSAQGPAHGPTRGQVPRMTSQIDCHPHRLLINLLPLVSGEARRGPILPNSFSSNKGPLLLLTGVVSGRQVETGLWTLCSDKVPTKPRGQPGSPPTPGSDEVIPYHRPLESAKP